MRILAIIALALAAFALAGCATTTDADLASDASSVGGGSERIAQLGDEGYELGEEVGDEAQAALDALQAGDVYGGCSHMQSLRSKLDRIDAIVFELHELGVNMAALDSATRGMREGLVTAETACENA